MIDRRSTAVHPVALCPYCGHSAWDDHDARAMDARCDVCHSVCRAPIAGDPIFREGHPLDFVTDLAGFVRPFPNELTIPEWLVATQSGQRFYVLRAADQDAKVALLGRLAWRFAHLPGGQS